MDIGLVGIRFGSSNDETPGSSKGMCMVSDHEFACMNWIGRNDKERVIGGKNK